MENCVTCSEDEVNPPVCCCFCRFPLPYLCKDHVYKHPVNTELFQHFLLPLQVRQTLNSQELKDQWARKLFTLHSAFQVLRRNESEMTRFEERLEALRLEASHQVDSLMRAAQQRTAELKSHFHASLESAISEVSANAIGQWTPPQGSLAELIWNYDLGNAENMRLFRGEAEGPPEYPARISVDVRFPPLAQFAFASEAESLRGELDKAHRRIAELTGAVAALQARVKAQEDELAGLRRPAEPPSEPAVLVLPTHKDLRVFDFPTFTWLAPRPLSTAIKFDGKSCYTQVDPSTVLICGNSCWTTYSQEAYLVFMSENVYRVVELPKMIKSRLAPGVIHVSGTAFVFGSDRIVGGMLSFSNVGTRTGEHLSFAGGAWTLVDGEMRTERSWFTPCRYRGDIYLCGGEIDICDIETRRIRPGPSVFMPESTDLVAVFSGSELTIVTKRYSTVVDVREERPRATVSRHEEVDIFPSSSPVIVEGNVYWVRYDGRCMHARLEGLGPR